MGLEWQTNQLRGITMAAQKLAMEELELQFSTTNSSLRIYPQIITPKLATQLIASNHENNRKLKPHVVQSYKRQMEKGLWQSNNAEGIKISETNKLLDGQHRLAAIIEYGKPVEMLIFSGIPEKSMTSIDDGIRRSTSDAFRINGKTLPCQSHINGALTALMTLHSCVETERSFSGIIGARRNSTSEILQFFDALPNFTETAHDFFHKFKYTKVGRVMPLGLALAMYYLLRDLDEELIFSIFKSYETGIPMDDLREQSPIYHACERSRRARELKIRVMPWDHIQMFLWVCRKSALKKPVKALPTFVWEFSEQDPITAHMRKKLKSIQL